MIPSPVRKADVAGRQGVRAMAREPQLQPQPTSWNVGRASTSWLVQRSNRSCMCTPMQADSIHSSCTAQHAGHGRRKQGAPWMKVVGAQHVRSVLRAPSPRQQRTNSHQPLHPLGAP